MSPERIQFKALDEYITDNEGVFKEAKVLTELAVKAFLEDHPNIDGTITDWLLTTLAVNTLMSTFLMRRWQILEQLIVKVNLL